MDILNKIKKRFFKPTCKCMYCNLKKENVTINIHNDLDSIPKKTLESLQICKNCLFKLAQNDMLMISLYSLTRDSVFKLLDKEDLSEGGKMSLSEMQNVLKIENKFRALSNY